MSTYINEITPEMTKTVDRLINENFENATPEEIEIYAEWTKIHALHDAEFQAKAELRKQENEARIEQFKEQSKKAMDALDALTELAQAKLKAVEDGI